MAKRKFNPDALRQFAKEFLHKVAEEEDAPDVEREDFETSLIRQWQTYKGNASFFVHDKLLHVNVANAGPGRFRIVLKTAPADLMTSFQTKWQLSATELPGILESLNLRQTAETVNTAGTPLCISVIPDKGRLEVVHPPKAQPKLPVKETVRHKMADKKVVPSLPTQPAGDYLSLAANCLARYLPKVDVKEMVNLARSVASQWRQYQGHACLFLDNGQQLVLKITNDPSEPVDCQILKANLDHTLSKLGLRPEVFGQVVASINQGHHVKYHDEKGIAQILWHDPKERLIKTCPEHLKT